MNKIEYNNLQRIFGVDAMIGNMALKIESLSLRITSESIFPSVKISVIWNSFPIYKPVLMVFVNDNGCFIFGKYTQKISLAKQSKGINVNRTGESVYKLPTEKKIRTTINIMLKALPQNQIFLFCTFSQANTKQKRLILPTPLIAIYLAY